MKKVVLIVIMFLIFISNICAIEIKSNNGIMYNLTDNSIIYEKNIKERVQVASLTKIATAITVLDNIEDLNDEVKITYEMLVGLDGYAKIGLKKGQTLKVIELLYALMLPSAADAAQALAIYTSGSLDEFSNLMNSEVAKLDIEDTKFDNPIGKDSSNNYSTAFDLSKILLYALKNDIFKTIFTTNEYYIESIDKTVIKTLTSNYSIIDTSIISGAKTGFTDDAGLCLASTATLNNINYLVITLGASYETKDNVLDTLGLYNYYSENFDYKTILNKNQLLYKIKIKDGKKKYYNIYSLDDIRLYLSNSIKLDDLKYEYKGIDLITKKINTNDKLGIINVKYKEKILYTYDIYLNEKIEYKNYYVFLVIVLIIIASIVIKGTRKKHSKKKVKMV